MIKKTLLVLILLGAAILLVTRTYDSSIFTSKDNKITLSGAWALYPITIRWAEEYRKIHPEIKIDVSAGGAGKGMADALGEIVDLGMVSRKVYPDEVKKGAWWVPVAKDAVVVTVNAENPLIEQLQKRGLTRSELIGIWVTKTVTRWGQITACSGLRCPKEEVFFVNPYTRSDACGAADTWARFLGVKQEDLQGIGVYGDPGLADAIQRDTLGIGYNNINYAYDSKTRKPLGGLMVIPLDLDDTGAIEPQENFYSDLDSLEAAIIDGRYPSPPARDLHFVSQGAPKRAAVRDFLRWVLTDGQQYLREAGYIPVAREKIKEALESLGKEMSNEP